MVAECAIDHGVAPVPTTRGGSRAGYARWTAFIHRGGLSQYADRRNDALFDGVSRMSAYLHYGMVSPFRLAREAHARRGDGPAKYLDELLIWREVAYAFCYWHPSPTTVDAIPPWARDTLAEHEGDPRTIQSWESLARARTGDALWDAAQQSLLIHGALHNNVRMTWGKAIPAWTRSAHDALSMLEALNHRYALDGRDPASYGGLLWCLGQFDRPFSPPMPVLGTVRPRPTAQRHQRQARRAVGPVHRRRHRPTCPNPPQGPPCKWRGLDLRLRLAHLGARVRLCRGASRPRPGLAPVVLPRLGAALPWHARTARHHAGTRPGRGL
jgi:hypothetical protein